MSEIDQKAVLNGNDEILSRKLDEKLMELHSLFELSQTLNSSLNLTSILNNLLLTPMGKMMISKGIILLSHLPPVFRVETLKGLTPEFIHRTVLMEESLPGPMFIRDLDGVQKPWYQFFRDASIELLIPIRSSNVILGIIGFGKKMFDKAFLPAEIDFLNSLSNIAATAIENGMMVLRLQEVNQRLDKKIQELNTLFDIGKELNSTLDPDKILNLLSYAIMGEMMVNRCMIFTIDKNGNRQLVNSKGHQQESDLDKFRNAELLNALFAIDQSIQLKAVDSYDPALKIMHRAGFHVLVPMRIQEETKGIIAVSDKIVKAEFMEDDLEFLFTLGNEAMICLENARLFEETLEKQRMEEELEIAKEIQQGLLPRSCPQCPGFEISAINLPSRQVGGDYYDCIQLDEDHVCLAIADVSGKGVPASLLMANIQASLHAIIDKNLDLSWITAKINNIIHRNTGHDKFITFFYGILDIRERTFTSVNAGHNPPYLYHSHEDRFELLQKGGLLLGMIPNMSYEKERMQLRPGDWMIMFTDGISEAFNANDEEFGEKRIEAFIRDNCHTSAEMMKEKLISAVKEFTAGVPQSDDITMIVVKVL